jgi:eukaryotic-like serine/threonine-protein kinase
MRWPLVRDTLNASTVGRRLDVGKLLVERRREISSARHGSRFLEPDPLPLDDGDAHPVNQATFTPAAAALVTAPFVGREIEMGGLRAALELAGLGRGRLLLVTGEPGIGKSRLMEEFSRDASELRWQVLFGRCWEGGGAPAYWPWMQVVQQAGGQFEEMAPGQVEASPRDSTTRPTIGRTVTDDPEAVRFRLFETVAGFLTSISRDQPLLVILDDIHVADEPSLLMLRFLAEAVSQERILVLASYREAERGVHQLAEAFAQLARVGSRISLRGLSAFDVGTYMEVVTGQVASASVVKRILDVTAGNPFFLSEVIRILLVDGRLKEDAESATDPMLRIPEEVRVLIRRRVASLSKEAGSTLRLAAAMGREFDFRVLQLAGRLSVGRLMDVLAEALSAGVIAQDPANPSRYAFAHDLVRETLYGSTPAARRLELHRTIGRVLEDVYGRDLESHLSELAHHFTEAAPLGLANEGVDYSIRAGDQAATVLAYEDAVRRYERALQLLPLLGVTEIGRRCEILLRLGDSQWRAGDTTAARSSFDECAEIAARSGLAEALARAALGHVTAEALVQTAIGPLIGSVSARFGLGAIVTPEMLTDVTGGIRLLEQALSALPEGDSSIRAQVLARLATVLYTTDEVERRTVLSDQAIEMARRLDDEEALLVALHGRHWATFAPEQVDVRLANAEEMLRIATDRRDDEMAFMARHARLHCCLELCNVEGMDTELAAMTRLTERIRQPFYLWVTNFLRATRTIVHGRLHEAERLAGDAQAIGRLRESDYVVYGLEHAQIVTIRWQQGRMNELGERIRVHGERYRLVARWRNAFWAVEAGDQAAAREEVERHAPDGFADLPRNGLWILHLCSLAEACVLVRDKERAAQIYDLLAPYADRNAIAISTMPYGPVALRLGMIATLLTRWDEADGHFELAMERCEQLGARAITARVLYEHATMVLARGAEEDIAAAKARLSDAERICRELDLPGVLQKVTALAHSMPDGRSAGHDAVAQALLRRRGEYWDVQYGCELARLRDTKGLRYIATLLSTPRRDIHVLELVAAVEAGIVDSAAPPADTLARGGLHVSRLDEEDALIDHQAREAYRRRLSELEADLQEARDWNDPERIARAQEEIDALTTELARAAGLGGRSRSASTAAERARVSVTKAIKGAVKTVTKECPTLGSHLASSIQTGRFCSYAPPGEVPPAWSL